VPPTLRSDVWAADGALDDFDIDEPRLVPLQRQVTDGWVTGTAPLVVYIARLSESEVVAYDIHCTHLGCPLSYSSGSGSFVCPCHGGSFDIHGQVTEDRLQAHEPARCASRWHRRDRPAGEGGLTVRRIGAWIDERLGIYALGRAFLDRKIPGNIGWWHTLGSALLVLLLVQIATGIALTLSYVPSPEHAYDSILYIDATPFGGLVRGIHHWAASLLVLLIGLHILRVFIWGAYRYPREMAWMGGALLFFVVLAFGFTGYLLPGRRRTGDRGRHQRRGVRPLIGGAVVELLRGASKARWR
jgi:nitrite reductase/ring-hydroxylating ferredoxin subunit